MSVDFLCVHVTICKLHFRSAANREKTSAAAFAQKYNLGNPQFGNFYQAEYDSYVDILYEQLED